MTAICKKERDCVLSLLWQKSEQLNMNINLQFIQIMNMNM